MKIDGSSLSPWPKKDQGGFAESLEKAHEPALSQGRREGILPSSLSYNPSPEGPSTQ